MQLYWYSTSLNTLYYFESKLKAFPILLACILLTEIFGLFISSIDEIKIVFEESIKIITTSFITYFTSSFLYFFYFYRASTTNPKLKKYVKWATLLFCVVCLINPFFKSFILQPQLLAIFTGSVALVTFAYLYLKEYRNLPSAFSNYHRLLRWISIRLLCFYPFILGVDQLKEALYNSLHSHKLLFLLIVVVHGCFIIGLLRLGNVLSVMETKKAF